MTPEGVCFALSPTCSLNAARWEAEELPAKLQRTFGRCARRRLIGS